EDEAYEVLHILGQELAGQAAPRDLDAPAGTAAGRAAPRPRPACRDQLAVLPLDMHSTTAQEITRPAAGGGAHPASVQRNAKLRARPWDGVEVERLDDLRAQPRRRI